MASQGTKISMTIDIPRGYRLEIEYQVSNHDSVVETSEEASDKKSDDAVVEISDEASDQESGDSVVEISCEASDQEPDKSVVEISDEESDQEPYKSVVEISDEESDQEPYKSVVEISDEASDQEADDSVIEISDEASDQEADDSVIEISDEASDQEPDDSVVEISDEDSCATQQKKKKNRSSGAKQSLSWKNESLFPDFEAVPKETCVAYQKAKSCMFRKPFYIAVMQPSYFSRHFSLTIPKTFARANLPEKNNAVERCGLDGKTTWFVECTIHVSGAKIGRGWKRFVQDNALKVGDVCVFEVNKSNPLVWEFTIFRS